MTTLGARRGVAWGVVPPVPTPLTARGGIDEEAVGRIFDHLCGGGVDGVFVLGSTGELASLAPGARRRMIRVCAEMLGGRKPLLVGVTDPSSEETVALAGCAAEAGADAVVVTAPYYFELSPGELRRHLEQLLPRLPLPVVLYNMPWLTGHWFDEECVRAALAQPGLAGFKDSSGDLVYLRRLVAWCREAGRDLPVLVGSDFLVLEALEAGAAGAVAGGANLYPNWFRALFDAWRAGGHELARQCQERVRGLGRRLFEVGAEPCAVFATVKAGLAALGLCRPDMLPPLTTVGPERIDQLREILADVGEIPLEIVAGHGAGSA